MLGVVLASMFGLTCRFSMGAVVTGANFMEPVENDPVVAKIGIIEYRALKLSHCDSSF